MTTASAGSALGSDTEAASDDQALDAVDDRSSGVHRVRARCADSDEPAALAGPQRRVSWTLLDEFERDGFQYQVMRRPLESGSARLTKREQQVLAAACNGDSNKSIACALGVAPSTVRVLLFRAAAKLGVTSRPELLACYAQLRDAPGA